MLPGDDAKWLAMAGNLLREHRQESGISLDEVAQATKIGKSQLVAIEEGNTAQLPAPAYVRGFVRAYAAYLRLDHSRLFPEPLTTETDTSPPTERHVKALERVSRRGRNWQMTAVLVVCVLLLAWLYRPDSRPQPVVQPSAQLATQIAAPPTSILPQLSSARQPASAVSAKPDETPLSDASVATAEGAILKLKVNQDCWLHITIDGALSQQYDLKAGDLIEWKAKETIALDLGNAGGVEGFFNGKALEPFGETGKVAHIVLKSESAGQIPTTNQ